jgi:hypothetical protein
MSLISTRSSIPRSSAAACVSPTLARAGTIGDPPRPVDDAVGFDGAFGSALGVDDAEPLASALDPLDLDPGMHGNPDPLGRTVQLRDRIGVHVGEQTRQGFQDRHRSARPGINMAEFERDHAAADKHDARRQRALAQHLVGGGHQLGAGERQAARLRAGGDDDVFGLQGLAADRNRIGARETAAVADDFDAALCHQIRERARNTRDHGLLAINQRRPVEAQPADRDVVRLRALDLVERVRRGDEHLFSACSRDWDRCRRADRARSLRP